MSDLRKRIKVEQADIQDIPVYPTGKRNSGKRAAIMRTEILIAEEIAYVTENNSYSSEEKMEQLNVFFNMNKILENYDELESLLIKFFDEKARKDKYER